MNGQLQKKRTNLVKVVILKALCVCTNPKLYYIIHSFATFIIYKRWLVPLSAELLSVGSQTTARDVCRRRQLLKYMSPQDDTIS